MDIQMVIYMHIKFGLLTINLARSMKIRNELPMTKFRGCHCKSKFIIEINSIFLTLNFDQYN